MADLCRMRLQEFADISGGILNQIPPEIRAQRPKLLNIHLTGASTDGNFTEISAPTAVMGLSTAVVIETKSADALDKNAAGGAVRAQEFIGIDERDEIIGREELMDATDGSTDEATTNLYKEVFHSFAKLWGTGGKDAEGQIDVSLIDNTVQVSIPIAKNESNGSRFKVPDNHVCMLFGGLLSRNSVATDEGVIIRIKYIDAIDVLGTDSVALNYIEIIVAGINIQIDVPKGHMFEEGSWISFHRSWQADLSEDYDLTISFLIWKK